MKRTGVWSLIAVSLLSVSCNDVGLDVEVSPTPASSAQAPIVASDPYARAPFSDQSGRQRIDVDDRMQLWPHRPLLELPADLLKGGTRHYFLEEFPEEFRPEDPSLFWARMFDIYVAADSRGPDQINGYLLTLENAVMLITTFRPNERPGGERFRGSKPVAIRGTNVNGYSYSSRRIPRDEPVPKGETRSNVDQRSVIWQRQMRADVLEWELIVSPHNWEEHALAELAERLVEIEPETAN